MLNFLIVGAGGFVGAAARYGISLLPLNERSVFPVNTLIINVVGAFARAHKRRSKAYRA